MHNFKKNSASIGHISLDDQHESIIVDFRVDGHDNLSCSLSADEVVALAKKLFRLRNVLLAKLAKRPFDPDTFWPERDRFDS